MIPEIGILQGRLTSSNGQGIQFFPFENWENEFGLAQKIEFNCMELLIKKDSPFKNPLWSKNGVTKIRQLSERHEIKIPSIHAFYGKDDLYPAILMHLIDQASIVGAKTILISFFNENILKTKKDKAVAKRKISKTLDLCEKLSIRLGIETEMNVVKLLEFVRSFEHPNIGVYYDIGNMASVGSSVSHEIRVLGDLGLIFGVHVKDRKANGGPTVPLGKGCVKFEKAFKALKEINYDGPLVIQGARDKGADDITLNTNYLYFVKNILKKIY